MSKWRNVPFDTLITFVQGIAKPLISNMVSTHSWDENRLKFLNVLFFLNVDGQNNRCGLSTSAAHTRVFTVHACHFLKTCSLTVSLPEITASYRRHPFNILGVQGWRSGESTHLPPMWPGFDSHIQCQNLMWVEFVGSLLCTERFSPGTPVSPLLKNQNLTWLC